MTKQIFIAAFVVDPAAYYPHSPETVVDKDEIVSFLSGRCYGEGLSDFIVWDSAADFVKDNAELGPISVSYLESDYSGMPEPVDDNPFHPESPEGRAWTRGDHSAVDEGGLHDELDEPADEPFNIDSILSPAALAFAKGDRAGFNREVAANKKRLDAMMAPLPAIVPPTVESTAVAEAVVHEAFASGDGAPVIPPDSAWQPDDAYGGDITAYLDKEKVANAYHVIRGAPVLTGIGIIALLRRANVDEGLLKLIGNRLWEGTQAKFELRRLNASLAEIKPAATELIAFMRDAVTAHIYDADNGDAVPADDPQMLAAARLEKAVAAI